MQIHYYIKIALLGFFSLICSVRSTIDRYKKACSDVSNTGSVSEANTQLVQSMKYSPKYHFSSRHILGEALSALTFKEVKNLETKLEKAISRIRSKKEIELQNANMYLRAKIAENERAQEQMNLIPSSHDHQYQTMGAGSQAQQQQQPQSYDARNFLPVNLLEPNHHYSRHDQPPLQLV
ncbi:hypothetical protein C3L33_11393, partial [Rhododendron williamsianum]